MGGKFEGERHGSTWGKVLSRQTDWPDKVFLKFCYSFRLLFLKVSLRNFKMFSTFAG